MKNSLVQRLVTSVLLLAGMALILAVSKVEHWDTLIWATLFFLTMDVQKDDTKIPWLRFLPIGLLMLALPYYAYKNAGDLWWKIADWQMTSVRHLWNWDAAFAKIPLNDPAFLYQLWSRPWFTEKLTWVYNFGFGFVIWAAIIRSFLARDWRKMLHYTLATHLLQTPFIVPFYNTIELHEVWYVLKRPDFFLRPTFMDAYHLKLNAQNCFPSMHTSIAFAVLLLAQREKGPIFRWGMTAYCSAMIFSTLYLDVHWTIDVIAGLLFGYAIVKLSDWVMAKVTRPRKIGVERTPAVTPTS
jgi:membrane-associated phospholipid phosphatase